MGKHHLIAKIRAFFEKTSSVTVVYLFGSVAKSKNRARSDVDLALLFADGMNELERFDAKLSFANELEDELNMKVDIVDLNSADVFFIHRVMLEKELVLDKNSRQRVEFEVRKRKEFFDRQRFFTLYHKQAMKRLEEM